ncbi:uncharacterized protein LOC133375130 [Rhineura floridana]|uniref:uncharacterized protein LOC133375130 n=1 Tax=Rhineura floridana TaxID=261503 RepID=UPI002AC85497|nr:uncharacterized protein LOC133375130 [Rhineura floridana]
MFASRLCLPLLLGWALLLGQPAWGTEEEEPPLGEPSEVEQSLPEEDLLMLRSPWDSDEHVARMATAQLRYMQEEAAYQPLPVSHYMKQMAVAELNKGNRYGEHFFKHLEDTQIDVKKAKGVMAYVRMIVEKTNCTREDLSGEDGPSMYTNPYLDSQNCALLPDYEKQEYDCTFPIFIEEGSRQPIPFSYDCMPVPRIATGNSKEELPGSLEK